MTEQAPRRRVILPKTVANVTSERAAAKLFKSKCPHCGRKFTITLTEHYQQVLDCGRKEHDQI